MRRRGESGAARGAVIVVVLLLVATAGVLVAGRARQVGSPPERILLIVVDTLRRDRVSAYGGAVQTPAIDAFARGGTMYTNAVGAFHQTSMSMAALFTGRTPSIESDTPEKPLPWVGHTWCGLARFATTPDASCVPAGLPTLAENLRRAGYRTVGIVSNPLLYKPAGYDRGFDEWLQVGLGVPQRAGAPVMQHLQRWLMRRKTDRFFLYMHFMDVHDWVQRKTPYDDGVVEVDRLVLAVEQYFAVARLTAGTTMILTADHGEALGEVHATRSSPNHVGDPTFEPVVRIPLMVWPRLADDPTRLMRSDDVYRLIHRIAGIDPGASPDLAPGEHFLTERFYRTYNDGRWKSMWPRSGGAPVLFDLAGDPGEQRDVAGDHPAEVARHRERIAVLSRSLAARAAGPATVSDEDRERLRALGYVQ